MLSKREQRVVRIFISSTFKDFEAEREILAGNVFPRLRRRFAGRGISVVAIDLRWGLEDEQIETMGLVDACLDQVVRCSPYFLGLLGPQYGTTVSSDELLSSFLLKTHSLGCFFDQPVSITELEFQMGVLRNDNELALLFASDFGETPDEGSVALAELLKEKGRSLTKYETLEVFEEASYTMLANLIEGRFPDASSDTNPEIAAQSATLYNHIESYIPGSPVVSEALNRLRNGRDVYLQGEKGVGKSAALAYCFEELSAINSQSSLFIYFCNTGYCHDDLSMLRKIALFFEVHHGCLFGILPEDDFGSIVGKLAASLSEISLASRVYIFVDAIEQIGSSRNLWLTLVDLCNTNENITCMLTGTLHLGGDDELMLDGLEPEQVQGIISCELRKSGRTLRPSLLHRLATCESSKNPVILKGILNELTVVGRYSTLEEHIVTLCSITSVADLFTCVMSRVANNLTTLDMDSTTVLFAAAFLSRVHFGASEDEILAVSGLLPIVWVSLKNALAPFLVSFDGRYRFNHQLFEIAAANCLDEEGLAWICKRALDEYFEQPHSTVRIIELANWAYRSNNTNLLSSVVLDPRFFRTLQESDEEGLRCYLSNLSKNEQSLRPDLRKLLEATGRDSVFLLSLCQALSRSGCVESCILVVDYAIARNLGNADLLTLKARSVYQQGKYTAASQAFEKARVAIIREGKENSITHALLLLQYAIAEKSSGNGRIALDMATKACSIFHLGKLENSDSLWCETYKASLEFLFGHGGGSETFSSILSLQKKLTGEQSYAYYRLICYSWQSFLLAGDLETADSLTLQSAEGLLRTSGEGPDYAWALTNRATVLACLGKSKASREKSYESAKLNSQTANNLMHVYSITGTMNCLLLDFVDHMKANPQKASLKVMLDLAALRETALSFHDERHPYVLNIEANIALVASFNPDIENNNVVDLRLISEKLACTLEGDNPDSLYLDSCAWVLDGEGTPHNLLERAEKMIAKDDVLERLLSGKATPNFRLAVNNGAALYLVPQIRSGEKGLDKKGIELSKNDTNPD